MTVKIMKKKVPSCKHGVSIYRICMECDQQSTAKLPYSRVGQDGA